MTRAGTGGAGVRVRSAARGARRTGGVVERLGDGTAKEKGQGAMGQMARKGEENGLRPRGRPRENWDQREKGEIETEIQT